ncbi:MAG: GNAT family N-acetyltransferase [Gammaproteobacteria bacterium]
MESNLTIHKATPDDAEDIVAMSRELLGEIMHKTGIQAFSCEYGNKDMARKVIEWIGQEKYFAFMAKKGDGKPVGFISLYEGIAVYAEGVFGTIAELFVSPDFRSNGIGESLIEQAIAFGKFRGWGRLEVTTPPLSHFARTLDFYEKNGFAITGGRKLKIGLER